MKTALELVDEAAKEIREPLNLLKERLAKYHGAFTVDLFPDGSYIIQADIKTIEAMLFNINKQGT